MRRQSIFALAVAGVISTLGPTGFADMATFQGLGDLPGSYFYSTPYGVSADGSTVVGNSESGSGHGSEAFRWTQTGGMQGLGYLPGSGHSWAHAISADGAVVVGTSQGLEPEAFRWSASGGMQSLGVLPGGLSRSYAESVSADGSVVVGYSEAASGSEAFRWTTSGRMESLGASDSHAYDVSADGSVIVGHSDSVSGKREAFRWTESEGMKNIGGRNAQAISADGSVIVGTTDYYHGSYVYPRAVRWTQSGGMQLLTGEGFSSHGNALDVSADGGTIVGGADYVLSGHSEAFVWDEANGMRNLQELLVNDYGLDLTGWTLHDATGVSADGLTIVGSGTNPYGQGEAWLAHLPEAEVVPLPSAFLLGALGLGTAGWRLRRHRT